jgi:hypothetical protein
MSFERKLVLRKMEDLQMVVSDHLIYVVAFPGVQEQKHWRKELWTFFRGINDLRRKSKSKIPNDLLIHIFYEGPFGEPSDLRASVVTAREHLRMDNLGYKVDEDAILADPFKDLVTRLLDEPSCLWDELN